VLNLFRRSAVKPAQLRSALEDLGVGGQVAIAHTSLSAFGYVEGGAQGMGEALVSSLRTLLMPAFTYYTLVWPPERAQPDWPQPPPRSRVAFCQDSRISPDIGRVAQWLADQPGRLRSAHPALSFAAIGPDAENLLRGQTLENPYGPIGELYRLDGLVILLGVDHRSNTSMHYGEYLAGQALLPRYVMVGEEVRETYFPNCSAAFDRIAPLLSGRSLRLEQGRIAVFRVREVVDTTTEVILRDPEALLCNYLGCRCQQVRTLVRRFGLRPRLPAPQPEVREE
jgi:aminoglycoside 3-N-acetyltransferase